MNPYRPKMTEKEVEEMIRLHKMGLTNWAIAQKLKRDDQNIGVKLRKLGFKTATRKHLGRINVFDRGGWRSDHNAISMVNMAIKSGKLKRPDNCETCGIQNKKNKNGASYIQAHHCDYNKPLEVMWLCKKCHHTWHERNKAVPKRPEFPEGFRDE